MTGEGSEIKFSLPFLDFEGPLDLLLHLVRKNRLDINDIPISELTRQYLEYIALLKILNVELASEFLVMASTLLYIKSRSLLPVHEGLDDEEDPEELRMEISRRLQEYEMYKLAAESLGEKQILGRDVFKRSAALEKDEIEGEALSVSDVSLVDLLSAFKEILERVGGDLTQDITVDRLSIADAMTFLIDRLEGPGMLKFSEVLEELSTRSEAIAFFLAILELARMGRIGIYQGEPFSDISLTLKSI